MPGKKGGKKAKKSADDDADLDALLNSYTKDADAKHKAEVTAVDCIPARANAAVTVGKGRVWVHGGECFQGEETTTYDDLAYFDTASKTWHAVKTMGQTKPVGRNGHSMVAMDDCLFLYGGEYVAKNGEDIVHLADLWRLDIEQLRWNEITGVKLPSARSAHRMTALGDARFAVFGGYHDTGRSKPKKFNDISVFKYAGGTNVTAEKVAFDGSSDKPTPRSGMCFASPLPGVVTVYGGVDAGGHALRDLWTLRLDASAPAAWANVAFSGGADLSARMGLAAVSLGGGRALMFGGLSESRAPVAGGDDDSKKKKKGKKVVRMYNDAWTVSVGADGVSMSPVAAKAAPSPRMSAALAYDPATRSVYAFGGVVEVDKGQVTLGDLWQLRVPEESAAGASWGAWAPLGGAKEALGVDDEDEEEDEEDDSSEGAGIDGADPLSDDESPFQYGAGETLVVARRLGKCGRGAVERCHSRLFPSLHDAGRTDFYAAGLAAAVAGGETTVLDVAAGGGLLTLLAAKAGARRVVGCEHRTQLAEAANVLLARNGCGDAAAVYNDTPAHMVRAKQPAGLEQTDVIVHDVFGTLLLGERALKRVSDARRALGSSVRDVVPRRGVQYATLVSSTELAALTGAPAAEAARLGLDLSHCASFKDTSNLHYTKGTGIDLAALPYTPLSKRVAIADVDFLTDSNASLSDEAVYPLDITGSGDVAAVLLTWEAFNTPLKGDAATTLSTEPGAGGFARAAAWGQAFQLVEGAQAGAGLPLPVPVQVGMAGVQLVVRYSQDRTVLQCEILLDQ